VATLYIFSGLPGTGKTTLAKELAKTVNAFYLRIDTIEQALRDVCDITVESEGYRLSYRLAAENLTLGVNVVADSCNPIELTRKAWRAVAINSGAEWVEFEVICTDKAEHKRRVEERVSDIAGLQAPDWPAVVNREYDQWSGERIRLDTAGATESESIGNLVQQLTDIGISR